MSTAACSRSGANGANRNVWFLPACESEVHLNQRTVTYYGWNGETHAGPYPTVEIPYSRMVAQSPGADVPRSTQKDCSGRRRHSHLGETGPDITSYLVVALPAGASSRFRQSASPRRF